MWVVSVEVKVFCLSVVVGDIMSCLIWLCLWYGFDNFFEGVIEGQVIVERLVQDVVGKIGIVIVDVIEVDNQMFLIFLEY